MDRGRGSCLSSSFRIKRGKSECYPKTPETRSVYSKSDKPHMRPVRYHIFMTLFQDLITLSSDNTYCESWIRSSIDISLRMRVCIIFAEWGASAPPRQSELHNATIRGARLSFMSRPEHERCIPCRESYMARTSSIVEECKLLSFLVYFIWIQRGQTNQYLHTVQTGICTFRNPEPRALFY